jgi:hypothetical protein
VHPTVSDPAVRLSRVHRGDLSDTAQGPLGAWHADGTWIADGGRGTV